MFKFIRKNLLIFTLCISLVGCGGGGGKSDNSAPPVALFTFSVDGYNVTFDASYSYDQNGEILDYQWDFGDNYNQSGKIVTHSYKAEGTYTVTLTVTNNQRKSASTQKNVTLGRNDPPVAMIVVTSPAPYYTKKGITFSCLNGSYDPDGGNITCSWDFGDGDTQSGPVVTHAYDAEGEYEVKLTVTDNENSTAVATEKLTVINSKPVAKAESNYTSMETNTQITFNGSKSTDQSGAALTAYDWDFGDGATGSGMYVTHAYAIEGTYTVKLTVTNNVGETASTTLTITIKKPIFYFNFNYSSPNPLDDTHPVYFTIWSDQNGLEAAVRVTQTGQYNIDVVTFIHSYQSTNTYYFAIYYDYYNNGYEDDQSSRMYYWPFGPNFLSKDYNSKINPNQEYQFTYTGSTGLEIIVQ